MVDSQELSAIAEVQDAAVAKNNSNIIALAVGGAMLAVGAGCGYFFGNRKGVKVGEESAKTAMKEEIDSLKSAVSALKGEATS